MLDRDKMQNFDVSWSPIPPGVGGDGMVTVKARLNLNYRSVLGPYETLKGGDEVVILLVGGPGAGYVLMGAPAHQYCKVPVPIGDRPVTPKLQPRLAPL